MKTIEKAAQEYAKSLNLKGHDSFDFETYAKQDFKAGVEFAQRWMETPKEIPPKNIEIIIKNKNRKSIYTCKTNDDVKYVCENFTYWRPIELE